jgi:hypothetical protein
MSTSPKTVLFLSIDRSHKAGYPSIHFHLDVRTFDGTAIGSVRYAESPLSALADLSLRGFSYQLSDGHRSPFNWTLESDSRLDSRAIVSLADAIKRLERKLSKLEKDFGHAQSFGAYVAFYAKALGIKAIVRKSPRYEGYQSLDISHAVSLLAQEEREWLAEGSKPEVAVNA